MEGKERLSAFLSDEFLMRITSELNEDAVTAITLHGSYVRGEAFPPYSDVDLVCIMPENAARHEEKRFIYREGHLLSISRRPLSVYRDRFIQPERAIFTIPGVREARILLDKNGEFHKLQQEAWEWTWEPLQVAADAYASQVMVAQTEISLKLLRALVLRDSIALAEMIIDLYSAITDAVAVQRGILVRSGNTYFRQVQESIGQQSTWTQYHSLVAGVPDRTPQLRGRGYDALRLYRETAWLLKPSIQPDHWDTIERTLHTIEQALSDK